MKALQVGSSQVSLVPVVRGLVSEGDRVRSVLAASRFDSVALSVSPGELEALSVPPDPLAEPGSLEEEVYVAALGRFGPVAMPPPCFVEAVRVAEERDLECFALDMEEEAFTDLFLAHVGVLDLLRRSWRLRRLARFELGAPSAQALVLHLDTLLTRPRGYRRVEAAREAHMADRLLALCREGRRPLALVEAERAAGVADRFRTSVTQGRLPRSEEPQ